VGDGGSCMRRCETTPTRGGIGERHRRVTAALVKASIANSISSSGSARRGGGKSEQRQEVGHRGVLVRGVGVQIGYCTIDSCRFTEKDNGRPVQEVTYILSHVFLAPSPNSDINIDCRGQSRILQSRHAPFPSSKIAKVNLNMNSKKNSGAVSGWTAFRRLNISEGKSIEEVAGDDLTPIASATANTAGAEDELLTFDC
jgi:hypothetical protein